MDTSNFVESSNQWIQSTDLQMWTKEFESGVEEGVDLSSRIKDPLLQRGVIKGVGGGGLFYHSMLCKWTTLLVNSTWVLCQ